MWLPQEPRKHEIILCPNLERADCLGTVDLTQQANPCFVSRQSCLMESKCCYLSPYCCALVNNKHPSPLLFLRGQDRQRFFSASLLSERISDCPKDPENREMRAPAIRSKYHMECWALGHRMTTWSLSLGGRGADLEAPHHGKPQEFCIKNWLCFCI